MPKAHCPCLKRYVFRSEFNHILLLRFTFCKLSLEDYKYFIYKFKVDPWLCKGIDELFRLQLILKLIIDGKVVFKACSNDHFLEYIIQLYLRYYESYYRGQNLKRFCLLAHHSPIYLLTYTIVNQICNNTVRVRVEIISYVLGVNVLLKQVR
jgi:hypothetical protein